MKIRYFLFAQGVIMFKNLQK